MAVDEPERLCAGLGVTKLQQLKDKMRALLHRMRISSTTPTKRPQNYAFN